MPLELKKEEDNVFVARAQSALEKIESIRKIKYATYRKRRIAGTMLVLLFIGMVVFVDHLITSSRIVPSQDLQYLSPLMFMFGLGGIAYWMLAPVLQFSSLYKREFLPGIANAMGLSRYLPEGRIDDEKMMSSKIWPPVPMSRFDNKEKCAKMCHSSDYFEGVYKGAFIQFSCVRAVGPEGGWSFAGLVLLVQMPDDKFHGVTIMLRNSSKRDERRQEKNLVLKKRIWSTLSSRKNTRSIRPTKLKHAIC